MNEKIFRIILKLPCVLGVKNNKLLMKSEYILARYNRQIFIEEIVLEGQRKIMNAKVLVIGAGGLGSPIIQYLAATGVDTFGVADFDEVELYNLTDRLFTMKIR